MRLIRFKGKTLKRLTVLRNFFYLLQLAASYDKPVSSAAEMMYIKLLIAELQILGMRRDVHCLLRDWANDERHGHPSRTQKDYQKAYARLEQKWHCKLPKNEKLKWLQGFKNH